MLPRAVLKWIQSLDLSQSVRQPRRDFANGYLVAEILSRYYPQDVSMHSFDLGTAVSRKISNWEQIQKVVVKRNLPLDLSKVGAIMDSDGNAAGEFVETLYAVLTNRSVHVVRPSDSERETNVPNFARPTAATAIRDGLSHSGGMKTTMLSRSQQEPLANPEAWSIIQQQREARKEERLKNPNHFKKRRKQVDPSSTSFRNTQGLSREQLGMPPQQIQQHTAHHQPGTMDLASSVRDAPKSVLVKQAQVAPPRATERRPHGDRGAPAGGRGGGMGGGMGGIPGMEGMMGGMGMGDGDLPLPGWDGGDFGPTPPAGPPQPPPGMMGGDMGHNRHRGGGGGRGSSADADPSPLQMYRDESTVGGIIDMVVARALDGISVRGLDFLRTFGSLPPREGFAHAVDALPEQSVRNVIADISSRATGFARILATQPLAYNPLAGVGGDDGGEDGIHVLLDTLWPAVTANNGSKFAAEALAAIGTVGSALRSLPAGASRADSLLESDVLPRVVELVRGTPAALSSSCGMIASWIAGTAGAFVDVSAAMARSLDDPRIMPHVYAPLALAAPDRAWEDGTLASHFAALASESLSATHPRVVLPGATLAAAIAERHPESTASLVVMVAPLAGEDRAGYLQGWWEIPAAVLRVVGAFLTQHDPTTAPVVSLTAYEVVDIFLSSLAPVPVLVCAVSALAGAVAHHEPVRNAFAHALLSIPDPVLRPLVKISDVYDHNAVEVPEDEEGAPGSVGAGGLTAVSSTFARAVPLNVRGFGHLLDLHTAYAVANHIRESELSYLEREHLLVLKSSYLACAPPPADEEGLWQQLFLDELRDYLLVSLCTDDLCEDARVLLRGLMIQFPEAALTCRESITNTLRMALTDASACQETTANFCGDLLAAAADPVVSMLRDIYGSVEELRESPVFAAVFASPE